MAAAFFSSTAIAEQTTTVKITTHQLLPIVAQNYADVLSGQQGGDGAGLIGTVASADRSARRYGQLAVQQDWTSPAVVDGVVLGLSATGSLGFGAFESANGIGIFVDPVTVTSLSLGLDLRGFARVYEGEAVDLDLDLDLGVGALALRSWETFELGRWDIYETRSSVHHFVFGRVAYALPYRPAIGSKISLIADALWDGDDIMTAEIGIGWSF